jgi:hypothetical protein
LEAADVLAAEEHVHLGDEAVAGGEDLWWVWVGWCGGEWWESVAADRYLALLRYCVRCRLGGRWVYVEWVGECGAGV